MGDTSVAEGGLSAQASLRMAQDEAMARYLQAMDNGLRSRKRSTSSTLQIHTDDSPLTSRRRGSRSKGGPSPNKRASPGRPKRESHDDKDSSSKAERGHRSSRHMSPESGSASPLSEAAKWEPESPAPSIRYCQGCGQSLSRRGSQSVDVYNCDECIQLYSLPPPHSHSSSAMHSPKSPSSSSTSSATSSSSLTSSSHWPASPAHKCSGCPLSFLFHERLRDHQQRMHT